MLLLLKLLVSANFSMAFTLIGTNSALKGYDAKELVFDINRTSCPSDIDEAVNKALDLWNSVPTSRLVVKLGEESTTPTSSMDNNLTFPEMIVIGCSTNFATDVPGADPDSVAGVGTSGWDSSLRLTKGFLLLNMDPSGSARLSNMTPVQRQVVIAHEIGHVLGLGHSEEPAALMNYTVGQKTNLNLHQDDMDGITYLYPRDELGGDDMMGCGSVNVSGGGMGGGNNLLLTLLLLMLPIMTLVSIRQKYAKAQI